MKYPGSMNHVYRLVWSEVQDEWVAVAEVSRGGGKGRKRVLTILIAATLANTAVAAPPAGVTVNGGTEGVEYTFDASSPQNMTVSAPINTSGVTAIVTDGTATLGTLTNDGVINSTGNVYGVSQGGALGTLTNNGTLSGGNTSGGGALNNTAGIGTLTNSGAISGTYYGINNSGTITTLTNDSGKTISATDGSNGVAVNNSGTISTLNNSGTISATQSGIVNAGTITTLLNNASGAINASNNAIVNTFGGRIDALTNDGTVDGGSNAIFNHGSTGGPSNAVIGTLTNNGTINSAGTAITNDGMITTLVNNRTISGGFVGISNDLSGTIGSLINNDTISGSPSGLRGAGIVTGGSIGSLLNNGAISADAIGILVNSGGAITGLTNNGTISASETNLSNASTTFVLTRFGISNGGTISTLTNLNTRVISGSDTGLSNTSTITALGHIGLNNTSAIGTVTNSGIISGSNTGFVNSGTVTTLNNTGLDNSGTITVLTNDGTISGSDSGLNNTGAIGTLTTAGINNTGTITALNNNGTISGSNTGLTNTGTITTLTPTAGINNAGAINALTNAGTISGGDIGINNTGTIGPLTNSGTITGAVNAIYNDTAGAIGPITNSGVVAGNIQNLSTQNLTFNGGTGTTFGTLTGFGGGSTIGTITNVNSNIIFGSGNLLLNDNINVGVNAVNNTGTAVLQVNQPVIITGNYNQGAGASLQIGVAAGATTLGAITDTGYGRLIVTGDTTIAAGSSIRLQSNGYAFAAGQRYVVVDTAGTANYNADTLRYSINGNSGTVTGSVVANGANSDLVLNVQGVAPTPEFATAPNAIASLRGLLRYTGISNAGLLNLYNATLGSLSQGSVASANRIGKQLAPAQANWAPDAPFFHALDMVGEHVDGLRRAEDGGDDGVATGESAVQRTIWGQAYGGHARQSERDQVDGYGANYSGLLFGVDQAINDGWRAGGAFSYSNTAINNTGDTSGSDTRVDGYGLIAYASYDGNPWYVKYSGAAVQQRYKTRRAISLPGFSDSASGSFNGRLYVARAEAGYPLALGNATLTPLAGLMYSYRTQAGYTENSSNGAALAVSSAHAGSLKSALGAKLEQDFTTSYGKLVLSGRAQWIHEYRDTRQTVGASFVGDATGQTAFTTVSASSVSNLADISLGATLQRSDNLSLALRYDLQAGRGFLSQTAWLRLRKLF
ncbi:MULTISPECIES: autotransporter domain-containing protein [unclassified Herbaspirillum]|uniref:autotransporter domain-containing protein n=2 Tax=Herbaspirillum TaxID=963 RepID=UPI000E2F7455|nr:MULTISPECIES: autotransporter domain-containing protein [unclassified Herbaspirillum]RFB67986.1 autotransporter domain-containing protein [Herbaspirillum sp. 3R-3a1]TFI06427.1 autotransporter domain-containing protein [Herbaspirillum sp. 3R11]TFI13961.1 autotransporter domain-containing protein [Herbaspirillum sp. 3R-11]TFI29859.1 autotransporter domain-containing protein [Herbaspirillum sp. 3C11]